MKFNYEHLELLIQAKINAIAEKECSEFNRGLITAKERDYGFITGLQKLGLTEKQVFDVFTNTDL